HSCPSLLSYTWPTTGRFRLLGTPPHVPRAPTRLLSRHTHAQGTESHMNFWGADTDQLREHGTAVSSGARRIEELIVTLSSTVESVQWIGPDADEFRSSFQVMCGERVDPATSRLFSLAKECEQHSEEQDSASEDGGSGGNQGNEGDRGDGGQSDPLNPLEAIRKALEDYDPLESDGFWGGLLGGPEAGYWGNLIWNAASIGGDIAGIFVEPTGAAAAISLAMDIPGAAIGYYDALQSFQDGDYYGTLDGLVTGGDQHARRRHG